MATAVMRSCPGIMDYVGLTKTVVNGFTLHLHYYLNMGDRWVKAFHLNLENCILKNRIWNDTFQTFTINPHDELSLLIARMSLKSRVPFSRQSSRNELAFLVEEIAKVEKPASSFSANTGWEEVMNTFYSEFPNDLDFINRKDDY